MYIYIYIEREREREIDRYVNIISGIPPGSDLR